MPKLNISVPDPLWESAVKSSAVGPSPSAIVQDALRRQGTDTADRAWMQPPADVDDLLRTAAQRLTEQVREQFQEGYRAALARIPDLSWDNLDEFARAGFKLREWLEPWRRGLADPPFDDHPASEQEAASNRAFISWFWKLAADLGSWVDPHGYDQFSFHKTDAFERGYAAGLRAAYELVDQGAGAPIDE